MQLESLLHLSGDITSRKNNCVLLIEMQMDIEKHLPEVNAMLGEK